MLLPQYAELWSNHCLLHDEMNDQEKQEGWQDAALANSCDDVEGDSSAFARPDTAAAVVVEGTNYVNVVLGDATLYQWMTF